MGSLGLVQGQLEFVLVGWLFGWLVVVSLCVTCLCLLVCSLLVAWLLAWLVGCLVGLLVANGLGWLGQSCSGLVWCLVACSVRLLSFSGAACLCSLHSWPVPGHSSVGWLVGCLLAWLVGC